MRALLANPTFNPAVSWSFRAMIFVRLDPNWSVFCLDHKLAVKLGCFENLRCIWSNPLILLPTRPNMPCLLAIAFLHLFFLISTVSSFLVWWTPLRVFGWATGCRRVMFTPRSSRSWQAGSEPDTQTARAGIKEEVDSLPPSWPMLDNVAKHCCCYRQADQIWGKTGQEMGEVEVVLGEKWTGHWNFSRLLRVWEVEASSPPPLMLLNVRHRWKCFSYMS